MLLLLLTTGLSFISVHSPIIGKQILKWLNKPSIKEKELIRQKNDLKKLQNSISITDNFAQYSRVQRQINKIDDDLSTHKNEKNNLTLHFILTYGVKSVLTISLIGLSYYFKSTPIINIDSHVDLTPLNFLISYPHSGNVVSFHFWVLCSSATARLIKL